MASPLRGVPDRRSVGAFLERHAGAFERLRTEALGVVGGPARGGDLEHAHVVEGALLGVEVRILPDRDELGCADRVGPGGVLDDPRCCRRWEACRSRPACGRRPRPRRRPSPAVRRCASSQPLTIWMRSRLAPIGSFSAATRKVGDLPCGGRVQVAAHRHALGVAGEGRVARSARRPRSKSQPPKKRTIMREPVVA